MSQVPFTVGCAYCGVNGLGGAEGHDIDCWAQNYLETDAPCLDCGYKKGHHWACHGLRQLRLSSVYVSIVSRGMT